METSRIPKEWWKPEDAAKSYRRRHNRVALRDGVVGASLAACVYAYQAMGAWMRRAERLAAKGKPPPEPARFPKWVRFALPLAREAALNCGSEHSEDPLFLLRDPFLFEQLMANPPLPAFCVQMAAFAACEQSAKFDWSGLGEQYQAALGESWGPYAQGVGADDLGVIASHGGRYLAEVVRQAKSKRQPGHPVDVFTTVFIAGVAGTYREAGMGEPKPMDLAEIAVAWDISQGMRKVVLRNWNRLAEQYRRRLRAGKIPISQ